MRKLMTALVLAAMSVSASAANSTIFSCKTENGSSVLVKKVGNNYEFTYGSTTFKNAIKDVMAREETAVAVGSGFSTSTLELVDKGTSYQIEVVIPRGSDEVDTAALSISKGDRSENVNCKQAKQNLEFTKMRSL
ncbi:Uncharacterised protein [Actinobacillus porcinus]|uniref:Uncharacterized protein n=1 Tax=Actinobacillus porcinus TaxID=51048 RepID=A0ABY6TN69_9PAST|nr:hypothetical protein [Actinobacillus porcinus]VFY93901.1 Uncharacterised protein [Actinobacillus porcinus]VTU09362.1 Uncharacterised protein [Actinobacillus porcinus]